MDTQTQTDSVGPKKSKKKIQKNHKAAEPTHTVENTQKKKKRKEKKKSGATAGETSYNMYLVPLLGQECRHTTP